MKHLRVSLLAFLLLALIILAACSPASAPTLSVLNGFRSAETAVATAIAPAATARVGLGTPVPTSVPTANAPAPGVTATRTTAAPFVAGGNQPSAGQIVAGDLQAQLEQVYQTFNASVVNIQVTDGQVITRSNRLPPGLPNSQIPSQALGSGFVWDKNGNIITNNHVVDGATKISVTFFDGVEVPATLVGRDPDSDLAVIKVSPTGLDLRPVTLGDSTKVQVGQFAVAIGNPFGLSGTMTFGIVSVLGRSLPATGNSTLGFNQPSYTIPDIIQTDAPINPGNSGGVLLDLQGNVIGVPSAMESTNSQVSSGVGFAIPSAIVSQTVPALISTGKVQHPYLGISGTTLNPDLAQAMNLPASQRGALVIDVVQGGPADQGGVLGSSQQVTVNGVPVQVGGDLITAIDDQPVRRFEDIVTYLARSTKVGQTVKLTVLRDGKPVTLSVTLANRPAQVPAPAATQAPQVTPRIPAPRGTPTQPAPRATPLPRTSPAPRTSPTPCTAGPGTAWLGVTIVNITPEIAEQMQLPQDTQGALVESVAASSPADQAGVVASSTPFTTANGQSLNVGGDVITAVNGLPVTSDQDLVQTIAKLRPGQKVTITVLRDGNSVDVPVTLGTRPQ